MRVIYLAIISVASILAAIYLRFFNGFALREYVTHALGFVARAAVEHLLAGFGMGLAMMFLFAAAVALESPVDSDSVEIAKPKVRLNLNDSFHLHHSLRLTLYLGLTYFAATFAYEIDQAYFNVFMKAPPHGYVQWEQVAADYTVVVLGILLTWLVISPIAAKANLLTEINGKLAK